MADETEADFDSFDIAKSIDRDYLVIVNDGERYMFGGTYDRQLQPDIIYASDCYGELTPIEKGTYAAFSLLKQYLLEQGIQIELYSCYRTEADQEWVYDTYADMEGWAETNKVMKPGFSEHHTGLLVSYVVLWPSEEDPTELVWTQETAERRANTPELELIYESLADFGFIERYPAGKEDITGVPSEPYEIRFVGSTQIAHAIMDNDLCLEEYISQ